MADALLRVLVVDDSRYFAEALTDLINEGPDMQVVGHGRTGRDAIELCKYHKPDLVVMDVFMPVMDGVEATEAIMAEQPTPILLITGSDEDLHAFELLRRGAVDLARKDISFPASPAVGEEFRRRLKVVASVPVARRAPRRDGAERVPPVSQRGVTARQGGRRVLKVGGIVASTGGPDALYALLSGLPADLPFSLVVVQHLCAGLVPAFVRWLNDACPPTVKAASRRDRITAGTVLIAPDGHHLTVTSSGNVQFLEPGPGEIHCPSGDRLLCSLARSFGPEAFGVVLSGIGRDGASGLLELKEGGGITMAQDEATSVVYGMPRACVENGAAALVLPPKELAATIRALQRSQGRGAKGSDRG